MCKKIFGYLGIILCGTGIYLTGFAIGEFQRHETVSRMYFQGYRTGYIKGYRRLQKQFIEQTSTRPEPLRLTPEVSTSARLMPTGSLSRGILPLPGEAGPMEGATSPSLSSGGLVLKSND